MKTKFPLFQEVIEKFSYGGQMVLSAMTNGIYILYTCVIDLADY